jgi:outer membrane protein OmpA-like peptidoglycan-associated protein
MGPNINTFNREKYPLADAAGNFYFSSDGYQGLGGLDICVALNDHGAWTKAIPMKYPFNSSSDDFGIVFLKDGKTGYITSNRYLDGQGDDNILYFNLLRDKVDSDLVTSVYTIGYKPQLHEIIAAKPTIATQPLIVATSQPTDILIYFDLNKSGIRPDAITHIDSVIHYMNEYPDLTLSIGGHCDSRGTPAYNIDLSRHRSEAALHYLRDKGISTNRMLGKGYGSTQLANHCDKGVNCTDQEYQLSRRVDFHFERK